MYIWKYTYLILPLYIKKRYDIDYIKSRIKFLSNLPLRQGGKKDVVNQQLKELKMKKLNLFVVRPSDSKEEEKISWLGSTALKWAPIVKLIILLLIGLVAFMVRVFSVIRYESVIHEYDPWFNYRTT